MWPFRGKPALARPSPFVLVADDDPGIHVAAKGTLAGYPWEVRGASSPAEAHSLIEGDRIGELVLALIDLRFPGEPADAGLRLIESIRQRAPDVVCCALTISLMPRCINEVAELGAAYVSKFDMEDVLTKIASRVVVCRRVQDIALRDRVHDFCRDHRLNGRQSEVVALFALGVPRKEIPARLGIAMGTFKTYIERTLARTGHANMEEVARTIRGEPPSKGDTPTPRGK